MKIQQLPDALLFASEPYASPFQPGTRVALVGTPTAVTLRVRTGVVARVEDEDYAIVRLDIPAQYHRLNGRVDELPEIRVMIDNLRHAEI